MAEIVNIREPKPNASKLRYTVAQVVAAVDEGQTCIGAAQVLGCTTRTLRNYALRYPKVQAAILEHRQQIVDKAEKALVTGIENGEQWAVVLALKTLGKDRGYVERSEITGADGAPMQIKIVERVIDHTDG
jgi:hypothetical protein